MRHCSGRSSRACAHDRGCRRARASRRLEGIADAVRRRSAAAARYRHTLEQALNVRSLEIEQLKLQLAKLKRMQFGRKSQKLDRKIEQLETRLEDLIAEDGAGEQKAAPPASKVRKLARQPLPEHLPLEERVIEPPDQACSECGRKLKPLGEDVSEQLEIIDSAFKVIRHIRRKKACACCDNGHTKTGRLWVYVRDDRRSGATAAPPGEFQWRPAGGRLRGL
jgi:hypothetical protein